MKSHTPDTEKNALSLAREALSLMAQRGIDPSPVNYAVWYHYALGDNKELKDEINKLLSKKNLSITDSLNAYLYNKYIVPDTRQKEESVESASQNTQTILTSIMQMIEKFSGDTATYNQQIDEQVSDMSKNITDPALKKIAKEIITRAVAIRDSGAALSTKLEESKQEALELRTTLERVTSEANKDFLTGVSNRKLLEAKLEEMTLWAKERNADMCLLMIDIDHFKRFNDTYGHLVGDEVLRKVGHTLHNSIKGKDFVARYGGEEFAVLLPSTPLAGGLAVAESLRKAVAETDLVRKDTGASIGLVTISIGVARFRTDSDSVAMLIGRADNALYRAKMGGRNRVMQESFEK